MQLELTIQDMFDRYPTLFKERSDCLNHLFCCIGNGYHWKNGELVSCDASDEHIETLRLHLVDGKAFQHNKLSLRAESQYYEDERIADGWYEDWKGRYPEDNIEEMKAVRQRIIARLPDDVYHKLPRDKRWSFWLSGYCTRFADIFNYPDDIKSDWLDGLNECKQMLIEDGYDVDHPNEHKIDTAANLEEYKRLLREHPWF